MALIKSALAFLGLEGITILIPGMWAQKASRLSEWCSSARTPPP